jgi:hypothetical protein
MTTRDMTTEELLRAMKGAVTAREPFSLMRLGSSELITLCQERIHPVEEILRRWPTMRDPRHEMNGGVRIPDLRARDDLAAAVPRASVVGIFRVSGSHEDEWGRLTQDVFAHYGFRPRQTCYAYANVWAIRTRLFFDLFREDRVLLVGKKAPDLRAVLEQRYGFRRIAGVIPIVHYGEMPEALAAIRRADFDLALLSCGVAAAVLAVAVMDTGGAGFDFGNALGDVVRAHREGRFSWQGFES